MTSPPKRLCDIDGCGRQHRCLGLCDKHYLRHYKGHPVVTYEEQFVRDNPPENGVGLIPLTKGKIAVVDEADYEWLMKYRWQAMRDRNTSYVNYRAVAKEKRDGKWYTIGMSRKILNVPAGTLVDHINSDTLDNRRANLRPATHQQNMFNSRRNGNARRRFKGVYMHPSGLWHSHITFNGHSYFLHCSHDEEEVALYYDVACQILHGEFARPNFKDAQPPSTKQDESND